MLLLAGLGLDPWDVLHQGLSRRIGLGVGTWAIIVGFAVLLLWIPLRQRPGIGTLCNVVMVGGVIDVVLAIVPTPHAIAVRVPLLLGGVLLNGIATGAYIGAGLGPGPRDGLMTGWAARGHSIRVVRTTIEVSVLGDRLGARRRRRRRHGRLRAAIGPLAHRFIPLLAIPMPPTRRPDGRRRGRAGAGRRRCDQISKTAGRAPHAAAFRARCLTRRWRAACRACRFGLA